MYNYFRTVRKSLDALDPGSFLRVYVYMPRLWLVTAKRLVKMLMISAVGDDIEKSRKMKTLKDVGIAESLNET